MRRGDWFFIFLSVVIVAIALLDALVSYQNPKPNNPNIVVIEPGHTQSVTGPAMVILDSPKDMQSAVQAAPKRATPK